MKQLFILLTIALITLSLSACGKKGELKPPPSYEQDNG